MWRSILDRLRRPRLQLFERDIGGPQRGLVIEEQSLERPADTVDSAGQRRGVGLALESADGIEDTLEHRLLAAAHGLVLGGL